MTQILDRPTRLEQLQNEQREADQARARRGEIAKQQRQLDINLFKKLPALQAEETKLRAEIKKHNAAHDAAVEAALAKRAAAVEPLARRLVEAMNAMNEQHPDEGPRRNNLKYRIWSGATPEQREKYERALGAANGIAEKINQASKVVERGQGAEQTLAGPTEAQRALGVTFTFNRPNEEKHAAAGKVAQAELEAFRRQLVAAEAAETAALLACCE
jgi:hypothetical protein